MIDCGERPIDDSSNVTAQFRIAVEGDEEIRGPIPEGPDSPIPTGVGA
jgi:hypothetical protein